MSSPPRILFTQFVERCSEHRRLASRRLLRTAVVYAVGLGGFFALAAFLDPQPPWKRVFGGVAMVVFFLLNGFVVWSCCTLDRETKHDAAMHCPHCETHLFQQRELVIATRNCPECGREVLTEPAPEQEPIS